MEDQLVSSLPRDLRRYNNVNEYRDAKFAAAASGAQMRGASPLPLHVEEMIEDAISRVGVERLAIVSLLRRRNLVKPLPNWLAVTKLTQNKRSKSGSVRESMRLRSRRLNYRGDYTPVSWPVFARIGEFNLDIRELEEARRGGYEIDTDEIEEVTRRWNERAEEQAINGWVDTGGNLIKVAGNTAPGILNAPSANSQQFVGDAAGRGWDDAAKTGAGIFADVEKAISVAQADNRYGPFALVVGTAYSNAIDGDYNQYHDGTIRERLLKIEKLEEIVTADRFPVGKAALIELTTSTIDLVLGEEPTPVTTTDDFGWEFDAAIVGCMFVRTKSDYDGNSGIVILHT